MKNITNSSFESPYKLLIYEIEVEVYIEEVDKGDTKQYYSI